MEPYEELERRIGLTFRNKGILRQALTHCSYLNEHKGKRLHDNDRLEFLGDALLGFVVRKYLYGKFPEKDPGELTVFAGILESRETATKAASSLGLNKFLLLSQGELKDTKSRKTILANTFEALIAAIYIDQGLEAAEKFIKKFLLSHLKHDTTIDSLIDCKSKLQTMAQEKVGITPHYKTVSTRGPDHDKIFVMAVYLGDLLVAKGEGRNKHEAELAAATNALKQTE